MKARRATVKDYMIMINPLLKVDMKKIMQFAAEKHKQDAVDLQREQMDQGEYGDGDGYKIEPPYRPKTVEIKEAKGQPVDRVTLEDTGEFKRKIKAKAGKTRIDLFSTDSKAQELADKYGANIFGLQPRNTIFLGKEMLPALRELFKKSLHIKR